MPHDGKISPSRQTAGGERPITLLGAANDVAAFDDAAFGKKAGELIARGTRARKRANIHRRRPGELIFLRKRES